MSNSNSQIYNAICKQQGLFIGTGTVVVATGWKPAEAISLRLSRRGIEPCQYAAVGNLYSPAGIDYLVRNLLANPQITGVLGLSLTKQDTNAGSIKALEQFMAGSGQQLRFDGVAEEDLERVRTIAYRTINKIEELEEAIAYLAQQPPLGGDPKYYYPKVTESKILPGTMWGHRIEGKTIADAWVKILHRIRTTGRESPSGYGKRQELIDLVAIVADEPSGLFVPGWLPVDRDYLKGYFPQLLEDAPSGVKYTYGSRLRSHFGVDQIEQCVKKLADEPDAASAVMNLWDAEDPVRGGSPCLNHIWLRIIDNQLSLTATFRSNDMFDAWCANAFGLRKLQEHVRDRLSQESSSTPPLALGPLITISQSAHIYDHSYAYADKVIAEKYGKSKQVYDDPVGNYEIRIEGEAIVVSRMLPRGNVCQEYRGKNPVQLSSKIFVDAPAMQPNHALYLGRELQRAWECLKRGENYYQD